MFNWLKRIIKEACLEGAKEAYAAGYEDAARRCHDLYVFGYNRGSMDAKIVMEQAETEIDLDGIEELDEELDPSVFGEVEA